MANLYIYADNRETPSGIPDQLRRQKIIVYTKNLSVADYIISDRCAIERKSVSDFTSSIFDGRLIDQFTRISETYDSPILIIEGDPDEIYNDPYRKKFFLKIIVELSLDFNARIMFTPNKEITKDLIIVLAQYEQIGKAKHPITRKKPKTLSKRDLLKFILMGMPSIGNKLANNLLEKFGNLKKIFNSPKSELARTKGVGKQLAEQIFNILEYPYTTEKEIKIKQQKLENLG